MKKKSLFFIVPIIIVLTSISFFYSKSLNNKVAIYLPLDNASFPKDMSSPTIYWFNKSDIKQTFKLNIHLKNKKNFYSTFVYGLKWKPTKELWSKIKEESQTKNITIEVISLKEKLLFFNYKSRISFSVSSDSLNASILYRQIPLPFSFAEQNIWMTSYSLYNVNNEGTFHNVLGSFDACGNCHSLSADGKKLALDFDAVSRDKGGYFIAPIDTVVKFDTSNYISWSKMTGRNTFGLLSKMSNDGRYIVTTVKDRVVSERIDKLNDNAYSQLFFPTNGILAVYDTKTKKIIELPGADDTSFVQTNATWTPDNKYIIFARAKAVPFEANDTIYDCFIRDPRVISDYVARKRTLKYDLYKIPFNDGKGGLATPIEGASLNGKSNYFPTISPDGKWIAFCQAENFMMLQPDSRIFIIPIDGGKAKKLKSNFNSMNSWHAWSPNGKWLLFTSKILGEYTEMFLTHIDQNGEASIPVLVENARRDNCAVNYPEFVNCTPDFKFKMDYRYINFFNIDKLIDHNNLKEAKLLLNKYIEQIKSEKATPLEYSEIARLSKTLGDLKSFEIYSKLAKESEATFSRK